MIKAAKEKLRTKARRLDIESAYDAEWLTALQTLLDSMLILIKLKDDMLVSGERGNPAVPFARCIG